MSIRKALRPWREWEETYVYPWDAKTSVFSEEEISGNIMVRENSAGTKQYATKKEVFQSNLKG